MDFRWRARWAWLALGGLALALGEGAWASKDREDADANTLGAAQSSHSDWCARVCGDVGRCPDPCPRCAPPGPPPPPPCPAPVCPQPLVNLTCPEPTSPPPCPAPVCPRPLVNLTCPKPSSPPPCPAPVCPQPLVNLTCPPTAPCPKSACPACPKTPPPAPRLQGYQGPPYAPEGFYYKVYKKLATWDDAKHICFNDSAYLVIPKTQDEVEALKRLMKKEEINGVYVGFHDNYHDGQFITVLGDPMNNEQKKMWASNQPGGGNKENCAMFFPIAKMHDYPCTTRSFFVCQMRH
ncbi:hypothetical protein R5R35_001042 [Gryllus longicercus]|uniref:C-type lectin domain-containing protein n=1 Tax=Gryllus longicercus TaxID=2509291 RepID=A0AAN9YX48_9ORTH